MESELCRVVDALPGFVWTALPDGSVDFVNRGWCEYTGATAGEAAGAGWSGAVHPDDRAALVGWWETIIGSGEPGQIEGRLQRVDGQYRWFLFRVSPPTERLAKWCALITAQEPLGTYPRDFAGSHRSAETMLAGEQRFLEVMAAGEPLSATLTQLCLLVEELCESCTACSILSLDAEAQRLWHAASPSVPKSYTNAIDGFLIGPDASCCGSAAYHGRQVIASDIASDPRWDEFRDIALSNGLRACWSTPIFSQRRAVLGTFAMFSDRPGSPTSYEQRVIAQITHWASIAMDRERSRMSLTRALDDLTRSEGRLRTLIDAIPTIAWCALADGSGAFWNRRWEDYTGRPSDEATGWGWQAFVHPDDLYELKEKWLAGLAAGTSGEAEARLRRFDGEYRRFVLRYEPLRDGSGRIVNWYGTNTDIENRKRAEDLLSGELRLLEMVASGRPMQETLEALCRLVEGAIRRSRCSVVVVDANGKSFERGVAPSLPPSFVEAIVACGLEVDSSPCAAAARRNEPVVAADLTTELRWVAGGWAAAALAQGVRACWSTPIASTTGRVSGALAIYYDEPGTPAPEHRRLVQQFSHVASIAVDRAQSDAALERSEAERRQAETEVRRSAAYLAEAQRLSQTGSFTWNPSTDDHVWSAETFRIFELDPSTKLTLEKIVGRIHPQDQPIVNRVLAGAVAGEDFECELRLVLPDRSPKYVQIVGRPMPARPDGLEFIGAVQDVTARRTIEEALSKVRSELAQVARLSSLGVLTASIAHEVNQPLSGIITNASTCLRMLAADPPNVDGARETARRTIRDGHRASEVITRLRALFGKRDSTAEPVDLNEATREVVALSVHELQRGGVILQTELCDDLPQVVGDRVQLQQVILNLLLNAADAMSDVDDRPRQLVIRTERDDGGGVRLTVRDVGVGVDPGGLEKLFEAFYTTKKAGMGIGLSVSRSIIERHDGRLWAAPNDGPGATFAFCLPQVETKTRGAGPPLSSADSATEAVGAVGGARW